MLVHDMPMATRAQLVLVADDANLIEAARLLTCGTDIVAVRNSDGILQGVITKTDVVRRMSICTGAACHCPVSTVMTRDILFCHGRDLLQAVSDKMKARDLKNIPLVDDDQRPVGMLTARAVLRVLLGDAENAEAQMIGYVGGVGYR